MRALVLAVLFAVLACGCTEQIRAKSWGGSATVSIPAGQKVVCATWKNSDLWVLTRPMRADEKPEILTLRESSSFGVLQGSVTIVEVMRP